jgi:hypothetical protein
VATAGSGRPTRRDGERRPPASTPPDVGRALREAREQLGATLAEIRDRTGISWQNLEALEAMDLAALPDQRMVLTAARRYSEIVGLDATEICDTALRVWQDQHSGDGATRVAAPTTSGRSRRSTTGQTARTPEVENARAQAHLGAFTQTAEIPIAGGVRSLDDGQTSLHFADTDAIPITSREHPRTRRSNLWFRATLGLAVLLLLVCLAGLAVHHYEPQWLADIHLTRAHSHTTKTGPVAPERSRRSSTPALRSLVTQTAGPTGLVSVAVHANSYQVVISAQQPCWIDASVTPDGSRPVFVDVLQAGDKKTLAPVGGRLSIEFGASFVTVQVQVAGKTVPGWRFTPTVAPFSLSFASSPGS